MMKMTTGRPGWIRPPRPPLITKNTPSASGITHGAAASARSVTRGRWPGGGGRAEVVERVGVLLVRRMGAGELDDLRSEDRHDDEHDDEPERHHRHPVVAQAPPEQLQRRAGGNLGGCGDRGVGDGAAAVLQQFGSAGAHGVTPVMSYLSKMGPLSWQPATAPRR